MADENPLKVGSLSGGLTDAPGFRSKALASPDLRDGSVYDCPPELHLALEVALATGRPLLIRGEPGTGKSSFAAYVARNFNWRYYEHCITSATQSQDLLWRFDAVRRLADAQSRTRGRGGHPIDDLTISSPARFGGPSIEPLHSNVAGASARPRAPSQARLGVGRQ